MAADCQHYTMGHCKRMQKHMTVDFGNRVAAWIISQSCPNTFIEPEPDYTRREAEDQSTKQEQKNQILNPMVPKQVELREVNSAPKAKNTTQHENQLDEEDILMEYAMELDTYMQDPEEQQYDYQDIEKQVQIERNHRQTQKHPPSQPKLCRNRTQSRDPQAKLE